MVGEVLKIAAIGVVVFISGACVIDAPGVGASAEYCMQKAVPVINALETFHTANGYFPERLSDLVPVYLEHVQIELTEAEKTAYHVKDGSSDGEFFTYTLKSDSWAILAVTYFGPGVNDGVYNLITGITGNWTWTGYF